MKKQFKELYDQLRVSYSLPKEFTTKPSDLTSNEYEDNKEKQNFNDTMKKIIKKMNGVSRRGKCMRDLHDKRIQSRDNDVQTTAVEVEE